MGYCRGKERRRWTVYSMSAYTQNKKEKTLQNTFLINSSTQEQKIKQVNITLECRITFPEHGFR